MAPGLRSTCDPGCHELTLKVIFDSGSGSFSRAQFGFNQDGTLHLEAHSGGSADCPTPTSPTPDRTLVLEGVPQFSLADPLSQGLSAAFFDFKGDILGQNVLASTKTVSLAPMYGNFAPRAQSELAFSASITGFPQNGSASGNVFAVHCDSMDE